MKKFIFLSFLSFIAACTTPPATPTQPTDTPAPILTHSPEIPNFDLGPIPEVHIDCLFQRQDEILNQQETPKNGSWRQYRSDAQLTGKSSLTGNISCPELLWAHDLGVRQTWVAITTDNSSESEMDLPINGETGNWWRAHNQYEIDGLLLTLDKNGNPSVFPSGYAGEHKIGDYLSELPGYERISCDTGMFQIEAGGYDPLPCYMQNRNANQWETIWTSDPFEGFTNSMSTRGQPIVGDFDNDGDLETAVLPWYSMHILDLATGRLEQTGIYQGPTLPGDRTTGRAYGFFGAYNLDDDPKTEFVILGDFEMFISVIGWRDGQLVELWDHQIEAGTFLNEAAHHTGVNPVADIDGDGLPEIVTSIYNENGDQLWHVVVFDGISGEIKLDLADSYLSGLGDLDGDGVAELFTTTTSGSAIPEYGPSTIYSLLTGSPISIWHSSTMGFEIYDLPTYPDHVNSRAAYGRRTMFLRNDLKEGGPVFITREQNDLEPTITLHFYQMEEGTMSEIGVIRGPNLEVISFPSSDPSLGILVKATTRTSENTLQLSGLKAEVVYSGRTQRGDGHPAAKKSLLTGTVVGSLRSGDGPLIITQGYGEQIHALRYSQGSSTLEQVWQVSGRGMVGGITANGRGYGSVLLADITGNGELAVIAATVSEEGLAIIKALDADGLSIWESSFEIPGEPPIYSVAGITNWTAGYFNSHDHQDILVSFRDTKYASDQLFLLEGRNGELLWTKRLGGYYSGCGEKHFVGAGGWNLAVLDWDGDGLDEILNLTSGLFAVYDGSDGSTLINRWTTNWCPHYRQIFSQGFLKHPKPVVADFLGAGSEQILFTGVDATIAVVQLDGSVVWNTPFFSGSPVGTMQGVGDLNGDSLIDLVSVGHCKSDNQEVQILDASNGTLQWSLSIPGLCNAGTHVSTVDLDGDGRDEALFTHENNIYAVGVDQQVGAVLLWQVQAEPDAWFAELGDVVIADVDGSGMPQLIVNTSSGYIYGFGSQLNVPPASTSFPAPSSTPHPPPTSTPLPNPSPGSFDFSAASGSWVTTDSDSSSMTLDIIQNIDTSFSILMMDEAASVCRKDNESQDPISFQAEASGTASGFSLNLYGITGVCQGTEKTISFDISFTYNPDTDTLLDSYNLIWHRK